MRKTVFFTTMPALLLIISLIAVSCAPANLQNSDSDTIYVYFGNLEAKAVDETAYSSEGKVENGTSSVTIGNVNDYYWAYSAVKADNLFTEGATYQKGGTQTFADCADDKGLGSARPFSKGAWTFELRAYASVADRNAGTQYLFSGKTTTESLTTATKVAIPVTYSYIAGKGTASFTISTEVVQDPLSGYSTYKITGVNAIIDGTTKVVLSDSDNDGKWTGTQTELASGVKTIGLEVFVDSETTARASTYKLTSAIILHGMTTEISGKATVTLTGATMTINFNGTSLPSEQPTEEELKYSQYSVGSPGPAGGTIIYNAGSLQTSKYVDTTTGAEKTYTWQCLEMAPADVSSSAVFGYYRPSGADTVVVSADTTYDGEGNTAIGQGRYNTTMLVYKMGTTAYTSEDTSVTTTTDSYAAKLCDDYSVTVGSVTYDDWFLPSIQELCEGVSHLTGNTWSSSEYSASVAWDYFFYFGDACNNYRHYKCGVRAVRAF